MRADAGRSVVSALVVAAGGLAASAFLPSSLPASWVAAARATVVHQGGPGQGARDVRPGAAALPGAAARPNLLLVTLDTTRADHLGSYGWPHARTPHLDRLAARGTRFARADTAVPVTLPSHATIFTGLWPPRHGVRDNGGFRLDQRFDTVAERLAAAGYDTAAAVSAAVVARPFGLAQGFRLWDERFGTAAAGGAAEERDAAAVTAAALDLLARLERPFFLWVHYYDPHVDYRPPARLLAVQRGPHRAYDAEIAHVDEQLGRLLAALPPSTVTVVVGDHGEMLGDHGEDTHGVLLHAGARRVPLLMAGPGVSAGRVVEELVRTADLAPTLVAMAGAPPLAGIDGESLLPLLAGAGGAGVAGGGAGGGGESSRGGAERGGTGGGGAGSRGAAAGGGRLSYSESLQPAFTFSWYPLRALGDRRWLYVDAPAPRLYDLAADPGEARDLAAAHPQEAERWRRRLAELRAAWGEGSGAALPAPAQLTAEERGRLAALGYLAGSGRPAGTAGLADPYPLIDVANRLPGLKRRVDAGDCATAFPELRAILRRNRDNLPALGLAGFCLMERGSWAEALPYFEHALELAPTDAVAHANAAGCLLRLGRRTDAEAAYRRALVADPTQPLAVANLARLLRERGDRAGAVAVADRAQAAGGEDPSWRLERGLAHAEAGRLEAALADFLAAAGPPAAGPSPRGGAPARTPEGGGEATRDAAHAALENAAQAAYSLGRAAQAADLYQRLAALDPSRPGPWKTLGAIRLHQLADPAGARAAFARALAVETDPAERRELEALVAELGGR